jgi:penicillin amidase
MRKWLLRGFAILLAILTLVGAAGYIWMRGSVPDYDGEIAVAGIDGPVTILRDANAVPHISAGSIEDAMFGLGYVHAQDRLWQMEVTRRTAAGRLSELIGSRTLEIDKLMRALGLYRHAEASLAALSPETRATLEAYAAGVNAWLEHRDGPLPLEFQLLSHEPEPWQPADSVVWGKLMVLSLDGNWTGEILRAQLSETLSDDQIADLFPQAGEGHHVSLAGLRDVYRQLDFARLNKLAGDAPFAKIMASNNWTVSGERTATGKPILANDPHLGFSVPIVWYMAHIEAPGLNVRGVTSPGSPAVVIGHNERIAWGLTTTNLDSQDLYIEKLDPQDPDRYMTEDGSVPFETREETISTGEEDVTVTIRATRHGPVLSDHYPKADIAEDGYVVALQSTVFDDADTTPEAFARLNRAGNWQEFLDAMRLWVAPMQNVVYADVEGHIGFIAPGRVPIRRKGDGFAPVPGWTGEYGWDGFVPFDELPRTFDPPRGFVATANARIVPDDYPHFITREWGAPYRQDRAFELLRRDAAHSVDDSVAMQADSVSLAARELVPLLLAAVEPNENIQPALDLLASWDGTMDADRPEPLLFAAWLRELQRRILADELGPYWPNYVAIRAEVVKHVLLRAPQWCDDVTTEGIEEPCNIVLAEALDATLRQLVDEHGDDPLKWRWGDVHPASFRHRVFNYVPLLRDFANVETEVDGWMYTLNRAASDFRSKETPYAAIHGASMRVVFDLADLANSRFIMPVGQSGNLFSPFYNHLTERWADFDYISLDGSPEDLADNATGLLTLRPAR